MESGCFKRNFPVTSEQLSLLQLRDRTEPSALRHQPVEIVALAVRHSPLADLERPAASHVSLCEP
eukprot:1693215-Prymnesium_polylepis.1